MRFAEAKFVNPRRRYAASQSTGCPLSRHHRHRALVQRQRAQTLHATRPQRQRFGVKGHFILGDNLRATGPEQFVQRQIGRQQDARATCPPGNFTNGKVGRARQRFVRFQHSGAAIAHQEFTGLAARFGNAIRERQRQQSPAS